MSCIAHAATTGFSPKKAEVALGERKATKRDITPCKYLGSNDENDTMQNCPSSPILTCIGSLHGLPTTIPPVSFLMPQKKGGERTCSLQDQQAAYLSSGKHSIDGGQIGRSRSGVNCKSSRKSTEKGRGKGKRTFRRGQNRERNAHQRTPPKAVPQSRIILTQSSPAPLLVNPRQRILLGPSLASTLVLDRRIAAVIVRFVVDGYSRISFLGSRHTQNLQATITSFLGERLKCNPTGFGVTGCSNHRSCSSTIRDHWPSLMS